MAGSLNRCTLIGYLGKDPEAKNVGDGNLVTFSMAMTDAWTSPTTGERQEKTEWANIAIWNAALGEVAMDFPQERCPRFRGGSAGDPVMGKGRAEALRDRGRDPALQRPAHPARQGRAANGAATPTPRPRCISTRRVRDCPFGDLTSTKPRTHDQRQITSHEAHMICQLCGVEWDGSHQCTVVVPVTLKTPVSQHQMGCICPPGREQGLREPILSEKGDLWKNRLNQKPPGRMT